MRTREALPKKQVKLENNPQRMDTKATGEFWEQFY
jgi:hypothetical protein